MITVVNRSSNGDTTMKVNSLSDIKIPEGASIIIQEEFPVAFAKYTKEEFKDKIKVVKTEPFGEAVKVYCWVNWVETCPDGYRCGKCGIRWESVKAPADAKCPTCKHTNQSETEDEHDDECLILSKDWLGDKLHEGVARVLYDTKIAGEVK